MKIKGMEFNEVINQIYLEINEINFNFFLSFDKHSISDSNWISLIKYYKEKFIVEYFLKHDFKKAKEVSIELTNAIIHFYENHAYKQIESKELIFDDYSIFSLAILSDEIDLLKKFQSFEYTHTRYEKFTAQKIIKDREFFIKQEGYFYSYAMQCLINKDYQELKKIIEFIENLPKSDFWKSKCLDLHLKIWHNIEKADYTKLESNIKLLITNSHKVFSRDQWWGNFISMPAIGYLKTAWINGIELDIKHPLIPMEFMPVQPLFDTTFLFKNFLSE